MHTLLKIEQIRKHHCNVLILSSIVTNVNWSMDHSYAIRLWVAWFTEFKKETEIVFFQVPHALLKQLTELCFELWEPSKKENIRHILDVFRCFYWSFQCPYIEIMVLFIWWSGRIVQIDIFHQFNFITVRARLLYFFISFLNSMYNNSRGFCEESIISSS